jgi:hypothetical protein
VPSIQALENCIAALHAGGAMSTVMSRTMRPLSFRALGLLLMAAMAVPSIAAAGGPTPTSAPTMPKPPNEPPKSHSGSGGAVVLDESPHPCLDGQPGAITAGVFSDLNAVVLDADAFQTSDFWLETSNRPDTMAPVQVIGDATHSVGGGFAKPVKVSVYSQSLVFSIRTPAFGQTRRSDSQFAKVLHEAPGVWLMCFEDGNDNDFNDLVVRVWDNQCSSEQLSEITAGPLHVKYDPRFLGNMNEIDFDQQALWKAEAILARAGDVREEMAALYATFDAQAEVDGYDVTLEVSCNGLFGFMLDRPGFTQNGDLIKLRADYMQQTMDAYVRAKGSGVADEDLPIAGEAWADLVDHELYHTYQIAKNGAVGQFLRYNAAGDYVNIESSAQMSQDLLADSDDLIERTGAPNTNGASYLAWVNGGLDQPGSLPIVVDSSTGVLEYRAAAFLQWLGERLGNGPTLEARVAEFSRRVYGNNPVRLAAIASAMQRTPQQVLDELRDFWVTALTRDAGNLASLPVKFRFLDESTLHGQAADLSGPDQNLRYGDVRENAGGLNEDIGVELQPTTTTVRTYDLDPGTALLKVTLTDNSDVIVVPILHGAFVQDPDRVRIAALPYTANGDVAFEPTYLRTGPARSQTETYTINAAGMDRISLVLVAGQTPADLQLEIEPVAGQLAIDVPFVGTVGDVLVVRARPSVGGVFARQQPHAAFTVRVDGVIWPSNGVVDIGDGATLILRGALNLAAGDHTVQVTYALGGQTVSDSATLNIPGSRAAALLSTSVELPVIQVSGSGLAGDPLLLSAIPTNDATPIVGATVTATITDPIGSVRTFALTDHGSAFDGAAEDGGYGAEAFGTTLAGTYDITFEATGTIEGAPFSTSRSTEVVLASGVDTDADGVADAVEPRFGLDPGNSADGSSDLDLDGASAAAELARGSNPATSDTDGGGEADGSEIANGADPLSAEDDADIAEATAVLTALDGRLAKVDINITPDTGSVRLYRVQGATVTDLGIQTGDDIVTDGPLAAGAYSYRVVPLAPGGRMGGVVGLGPIEVRDDVTAPLATLAVTGGNSITKNLSVALHFNGVSGSPTQMRLAESEEALETAPWVAFQEETTFGLSAVDGPHVILAQLRDAAGNATFRLTVGITLDRQTPSSVAGPLPAYTLGNSTSVPYVSTDEDLGIVELWSRTRATPTAPWSAWTLSGMGDSPIFLGLSDGYYEFATVAVDLAGNREALPAVGDAAIRVGPETVNDDLGLAFQGSGQATTGRDGSIAAVWVDNRNSATIADVYFARRVAATFTWGTNERVDDASVAVSSPAVAIDASGNVYVAWVDTRRGDKDIYVAKRTAATGLWGPSVLINDDAAGSVQDTPSIAVSATGEVIVAWADYRSNKQHIYSARLPAGSSTWSADIRVTSDQTKPKAAPSVVIGPTGTAYVAWQQTNQRVGVWFSSLTLGSTTWATAVQINDPAREQRAPHLGVDASGRLVVIYLEFANTIWSRTRPAGSSTWGTATFINGVTPSAFSPALWLRSDGYGYAAWTTTTGELWGVAYDPATSSWGTGIRLSAGTGYRVPGVAMTATEAIVTGEVGSGTQANMRAYPVPVP